MIAAHLFSHLVILNASEESFPRELKYKERFLAKQPARNDDNAHCSR